MKQEIGRVILNNITLVEYDAGNGETSFFIQCGVAGFHATQKELNNIASVINYHQNIETFDDIIISIK